MVLGLFIGISDRSGTAVENVSMDAAHTFQSAGSHEPGKYLDKIKSILFSAIVRSSSDLSGLSRLAVG